MRLAISTPEKHTHTKKDMRHTNLEAKMYLLLLRRSFQKEEKKSDSPKVQIL